MSQSVKHTPGPWAAVRNSSFWEIQPANAGVGDTPFNIGDVCASSPGFPDSGLQEANAKLIAAAPDLLDACVVAIGHMTGGMDGDWRNCDPVETLRAAIAKAQSTGDSHERE